MTRLISIVCASLLSSAMVPAQQAGNPAGLSPDTPGLEAASPAAETAKQQYAMLTSGAPPAK